MKGLMSVVFCLCLVFLGTSVQAKDPAGDATGNVHPEQKRLVPEALINERLSASRKRALSREVLDSLFGKLHKANSEKRARFFAGAIWKIWGRSGSRTSDLLLVQAGRAMRAGRERIAIFILTTIIEQSPDFAEAWNKRATAYFIAGDYERSIADIREVLKREPRHFGALSGLGLIYQRQGKKQKALAAFRRALAIHPYLPDARRAVKRLKGKLEQDI